MNQQLTKEQLSDMIFNLEMELLELKGLKWCASFGDTDLYEMDKQIEETLCYIHYYQEELKDLEDVAH